MSRDLENAWSWREKKGILARLPAVRVFHGPGEGQGAWREVAIDRFGSHYWVTSWGAGFDRIREETARFLEKRGAQSAAVVVRPEKGIAHLSEALVGAPPEGRFWVEEGSARFSIQLMGTRHPGLFLDHEPLRAWLAREARGWKVLNTFAYTGSLSVACGVGGAKEVTTLDLSKPTLQWARENWEGNRLGEARFLVDDYFERLPRLARAGERFDCVILDPPSFSRGKKGTFSTAKDLRKLHAAAFPVLAEGGVLVTSINSATVSWAKFESELQAAARAEGVRLKLIEEIELPETFRTTLPEDRYLKGGIFKRL